VRERAQRHGLVVVFETAGTGLAVFKEEDPHVGRLTLLRQ